MDDKNETTEGNCAGWFAFYQKKKRDENYLSCFMIVLVLACYLDSEIGNKSDN